MSISMLPFTTSRRKREQGFTLLEVIVSLGIISAATIGMNMIASRYSDDTKLTIAASQTRTFGEAAKAYIKDNYAAIQAVATPTAPAMVDVPTLIASGHLTTGFMSTNAFGQSLCALVLEPTANRLQAMVVAEGGTAIDDLSLGSLAAIVGGSGGGTYSSDATVIRGAVGGWAIATATFDNLVNNVTRKCDGTAGNVRVAAGTPAMALWFENGDTSSAFLARDAVPGRPELNAMNTPIVMNSVQVANDACSTLGAIARSSTGAVLSCQSGLWKTQGSSFWEDPVASFAALPTCNAAVAWQTRVVQTPTVGTGPRAYTCTGTAWTALAVNDSGNITIAGIATAGKVLLSDTVVQGSACSPNGLLSKDAAGQILSCQSGTWDRSGGRLKYGGLYAMQYSLFTGSFVCYAANPSTGGCSCPSTYNTQQFYTGTGFNATWEFVFYSFNCWG
ncbi:shufflon system plasmid conjugative transfer pilus tip adhesin PilV [Polaromonas sp.]|uniref:shufflon system plasmid conjugative transfer pilus tip adhesin PilV n=1 Tax=Polaromonas sp. TaxID=1869339 RepID=UPI00352BCCBC